MTPLDWYRLGMLFAINGTAFLAGVATIALTAITLVTAVRLTARPITVRIIAIRARRRAWRTHSRSGRA